MITTRVDASQRAALGTLTTEWETPDVLATRTSLYRNSKGLSMVLGQLARLGLAEGRGQRERRQTEWRITPAGQALLAPIVAGDAS